jgi:hypothetical protein
MYKKLEIKSDSSTQCSWLPYITIEYRRLFAKDRMPPLIRDASIIVGDSIKLDILQVDFAEKIKPKIFYSTSAIQSELNQQEINKLIWRLK